MSSVLQIHLFDIDIPGETYFKESKVLSPGNEPMAFDTSKPHQINESESIKSYQQFIMSG